VVNGERRSILRARETPKGFLVDLEGVRDRRTAAALRGAELLLDRDELDVPSEGEFYVGDLLGLEAFDEAGEKLGTVVDLLETPVHEVLVVEDKSGDSRYVPFTRAHVPELSLEVGRLVVAPPQS
jgi:16S rRNA processing protein RimM